MRRAQQMIDIAVPPAVAWELIGPGFATIGTWAATIPASRPVLAAAGDAADAPVPGRECSTAIVGLPTVEERIVAYDPLRRRLTYEATDGLPTLLAHRARNTWTVDALGADAARVRIAPDVELTPFGRLLSPALALWLGRIGRRTLEDLRHRAETGRPSPAKRRQVARAAPARAWSA